MIFCEVYHQSALKAAPKQRLNQIVTLKVVIYSKKLTPSQKNHVRFHTHKYNNDIKQLLHSTTMTNECFLIIEDQPSMASLLKTELQKLTPLTIHTCHSLAEAKDLIESGIEVAVCLSDLQLPDSYNGEVIEYLKHHHITTVVLTASYKEETREEMFRLKVADYVIKDSLSSIRYAVQITDRLYKNAQRMVWMLSSGSRYSSKLLGMLRNHRFQVRLYENCSEMTADLKETLPSLILLDSAQNVINNNTFDFTKNIRNRYSQSQLPIISCEDSENISSAIKLMKYGVNDFFNTNFTPEEFYVRVNQNIEQAETFKEIEHISQTDGLTGLYNRRFFFQKGDELFTDIKAQGQYFFTLMGDIDHFKNVNDTYGHQKGDEAIIFTANCIQDTFSDYLVARFGGEEFCVFGQVEDTSEIEALCETLRQTIETESENQTGVSFTISQGVTYSGDTLDDAISKADKALYQSKESGRNKLSVAF